MSVLIKGMDIPESCWDCYFQDCGNCRLNAYKVVDKCIIEGRIDNDCPLVPVPTPHGRLIDRDALSEFYRNQPYDPKLTEEELRREKIQRENIDLWVLNYIFDRDAPTIIEAEGEDNG